MKDEKKPYEAKFSVSPYFLETYNFDPKLVIHMEKPMDLPFNAFTLARKMVKDKHYSSNLLQDYGTTFVKSTAAKVLRDKKCEVMTKPVFLGDNGDEAVDYLIPVTNNESSIFKPSVMLPISDACNVTSKATMEVLFAFDDGYVVPVLKTVQTESCSFMDLVSDIIRELDGSAEELEEFFAECPNAYISDGSMMLTAASKAGITELAFDFSDSISRHELRRAVCSFRLIDLNETIT